MTSRTPGPTRPTVFRPTVRGLAGWMLAHAKEHQNHRTGQYNATTLGEEAADTFRLYRAGTDYDAAPEVFEVAFAITSRLEGHMTRIEAARWLRDNVPSLPEPRR